MAVIFTKVDDGTYITYTGSGDAAGQIFIVKKDDNNIDIHSIVPATDQSNPQKYQDVCAELDVYVQ